MDKKLYIANWKSHKTEEDALSFFKAFEAKISEVNLDNKEIVIAPPTTLLMKCKYLIEKGNLPIKLAAQNVSSFPEGAYTGEISAKQVKEFADYVIIGHSERRKYQHENEADLENKSREAIDQGLIIIQCIQDENSSVHSGVKIVAYEPPSAIGSGNPDDPKHIQEVFEKIGKDNPEVTLLYGGSVNSDTLKSFIEVDKLGGFLIGGASLEAEAFISLLSQW